MQLPVIRHIPIYLTRYQSGICRFKWTFLLPSQYAFERLQFVTGHGTSLHSGLTQTVLAQQA
jgi:hypothetical protein